MNPLILQHSVSLFTAFADTADMPGGSIKSNATSFSDLFAGVLHSTNAVSVGTEGDTKSITDNISDIDISHSLRLNRKIQTDTTQESGTGQIHVHLYGIPQRDYAQNESGEPSPVVMLSMEYDEGVSDEPRIYLIVTKGYDDIKELFADVAQRENKKLDITSHIKNSFGDISLENFDNMSSENPELDRLAERIIADTSVLDVLMQQYVFGANTGEVTGSDTDNRIEIAVNDDAEAVALAVSAGRPASGQIPPEDDITAVLNDSVDNAFSKHNTDISTTESSANTFQQSHIQGNQLTQKQSSDIRVVSTVPQENTSVENLIPINTTLEKSTENTIKHEVELYQQITPASVNSDESISVTNLQSGPAKQTISAQSVTIINNQMMGSDVPQRLTENAEVPVLKIGVITAETITVENGKTDQSGQSADGQISHIYDSSAEKSAVVNTVSTEETISDTKPQVARTPDIQAIPKTDQAVTVKIDTDKPTIGNWADESSIVSSQNTTNTGEAKDKIDSEVVTRGVSQKGIGTGASELMTDNEVVTKPTMEAVTTAQEQRIPFRQMYITRSDSNQIAGTQKLSQPIQTENSELIVEHAKESVEHIHENTDRVVPEGRTVYVTVQENKSDGTVGKSVVAAQSDPDTPVGQASATEPANVATSQHVNEKANESVRRDVIPQQLSEQVSSASFDDIEVAQTSEPNQETVSSGRITASSQEQIRMTSDRGRSSEQQRVVIDTEQQTLHHRRMITNELSYEKSQIMVDTPDVKSVSDASELKQNETLNTEQGKQIAVGEIVDNTPYYTADSKSVHGNRTHAVFAQASETTDIQIDSTIPQREDTQVFKEIADADMIQSELRKAETISNNNVDLESYPSITPADTGNTSGEIHRSKADIRKDHQVRQRHMAEVSGTVLTKGESKPIETEQGVPLNQIESAVDSGTEFTISEVDQQLTTDSFTVPGAEPAASMHADQAALFAVDNQDTPEVQENMQIKNHTAERLAMSDPDAITKSIVRHASIMIKQGESSARIQLEPPHLGKLSLEIVTEHSKVTGKITVESAEVRDMIQNNLSQLRENLAQSGLKVESFDVQVGHNGGSDSWARMETARQQSRHRMTSQKGNNTQDPSQGTVPLNTIEMRQGSPGSSTMFDRWM